VNQFTVRTQSKFNKIRLSPDPVQSKTSPMLISGVKRNFWPLRNFWPITVYQFFCFSEWEKKDWKLRFWCVLCKL